MLLVILGAGASYDSATSRPLAKDDVDRDALLYRLPLADGLFSDRPAFSDSLKRYGRMRGIVTALRSGDPNKSVEKVLQRLQSQRDTIPERYNQLAAVRFYLKDMLRDCQRRWGDLVSWVTNYGALIHAIQSEPKLFDLGPVCFVTFNYDTLLESALADAAIPFSNIPDYVARDDFKVFKVHGSIDWGRQIPISGPFRGHFGHESAVERIINEARQIKVTDTFVKSDFSIDANAHPIFPAIAIPIETKSEFECPPDHLTALEKLLPNTSKILVVGWRGMESHFLELLGRHVKNPVEAMAVGKDSREANQTLDRLGAHVKFAKRLATDGGFSYFISNDKWQPLFAS